MLFTGKRHYPAKIRLSLPHDPETKSGLLRIDVEIDLELGSNVDSASLRVGFDDPNVPNCERTVGTEELSRRPFFLVINSHLLRNGPTEVTFKLHDLDGRQLGSKNVRLNFSNSGPLARNVTRSLRRSNSPAVFFGDIDSSLFDYADDTLTPWFDRSTAQAHVADRLENSNLDQKDADSLSQFILEGYTTLGVKIDDDLIDRVNADLNDAIENRWQNYDYGSSQRLEHLHSAYSSFYELWTHPRIMHFLNLVFEVPARPCQTLTYVFGSQQDLHQDTIHLTPFPAGYMCGVWVALEDVQNNSGELIVVPGSHRWQRVYMQTVGCQRPKGNDWTEFGKKVVGRWRNMISEHSSQPVTYRPKKGTVLIWHENLMHGGGLRLDKSLSRRSMVGHYFADGAIVSYDSAGAPGCIL
jgi:hypothetical protein